MKTKTLMLIGLLLLNLSPNALAQEGSVDTSFNYGTGFNNTINSVAIQQDGKILVAGSFTSYNGTNRHHLARLNVDGSLDTSFVPPLSSFYTSTATFINIRIQRDGKIIFLAFTTSANSSNSQHMIRLNPDGSYDNTFNVQPNGSVQDYTINADGSFVIVGNFTRINGISKNNIVKISSTGVVDNSFNIGTGFSHNFGSSYVGTIIQLSNGKYVVGGAFNSYNGTTCENFMRLNPNGNIDTSTNIPSFDSNVRSIRELNDAKIIVTGDFLAVDGYSFSKLVKLLPNGTIDPNFAFQSDFRPQSVDIQLDGKIITSGNFTTVDGVSRNRIARHKTDLSLDSSFQVGTGFNDITQDVKVQTDGKIIVVGGFTSYNGTTANRIVRLNGTPISATNQCYEITGTINGNSSINPNGRIFTNGINSTCETPKAFPGQTTPFAISYNTYSITNTSGADECVTFTLTNPNPEWIQMSVYQNSYNPANMAQNYLGGIGENTALNLANQGISTMSLNVTNGTKLVIVVNENGGERMTGNYTLKIDGLCATPSVRITPISFLEGLTTSKPIFYYNVNFIQAVDGFSVLDLVLNGETGANTAFIVPQNNPTNYKDYVIGVFGMKSNGHVQPSFLSNSVTSLSLGVSNFASINTSKTNTNSNAIGYIKPTEVCTLAGSSSVPKLSPNYTIIYSSPTTACSSTLFDYIPFATNTRVHQFVNNTGSAKCLGFKVSTTNANAPRFQVFKNNMPTTVSEYLDNWLGGSNLNAYVSSISTGIAIKAGYANIEAGQTFFVEIETPTTDYNLILEGISCGQVLKVDNFGINDTIQIYPNPSNGIFTVTSEKTLDSITIYNTNGQKLMETQTNTIDLSSQAKGIYFAEIVSDNKKTIQKLLLN